MVTIDKDYTLFTEFLAEKAKMANEQDGVRYALGSKAVDIAITPALLNEFIAFRAKAPNNKQGSLFNGVSQKLYTAQEASDLLALLGFISATGAKSGVIACRVTYPVPTQFSETTHTATTIALAKEMEAHVSLVLNCLQRAMQQESNPVFHEINQALFEELNRRILLDQVQFLNNESPESMEKFQGARTEVLAKMTHDAFIQYIDTRGDAGHIAFNKFLGSKRSEYAAYYRQAVFEQLALKNLSPSLEQTESAIKLLKKTPASFSDELLQNSATGQYFTRTATEFTAHDKQLSTQDKAYVPAMRIVLPNGTVIWRVPSVPATDAYEKKVRGDYVQDTKQKLDLLSQAISNPVNGGDPTDFVYYNLLTSPHNLVHDTEQTWSTHTIIQGVHACNRQKINNNKRQNLIMLCNIPVNQSGTMDPDAKMMLDLAIVQLLGKATQNKSVQALAEKSLAGYVAFLSNNKTDNFKDSDAGLELARDIIALRETEIHLDTANKSNKDLATLVVLKMFMNETYIRPEYGMLMQALMCAAETNKLAGCKSANERFASVMAKMVSVNDPRFAESMRSYLEGKINENVLYEKLMGIYNTTYLYEDIGQACSLADQGAGPKTGVYEVQSTTTPTSAMTTVSKVTRGTSTGKDNNNNNNSADNINDVALPMQSEDDAERNYSQSTETSTGSHEKQFFSLAYSTNNFESPLATRLNQKSVSTLQAHKTGELVGEAFNTVRRYPMQTTLETLLSQSRAYANEKGVKPSYYGEEPPPTRFASLKLSFSSRTAQNAEPTSSVLNFKQETAVTLINATKLLQKALLPPNTDTPTQEALHQQYTLLIQAKKKVNEINNKRDSNIKPSKDLPPLLDAAIAQYEKILCTSTPRYDKYPEHSPTNQGELSINHPK